MKNILFALLLVSFSSKAQCLGTNAPLNILKPSEVITYKGQDNSGQIFTMPIAALIGIANPGYTANAVTFQNKVFTVKGYTSKAIQSALDSAHKQGGEVYAPDGVYLITATLTIGSYTKLILAPNAIFRRNASINAMLLNKHNGTTGGYGQASNIEITGGTWDINGKVYATNVTGIATGHASCIYIHDTKVINCYGWHFIELNATQHATIKNVVFQEGTTTGREMLQLDLMKSAGAFPWFGPYDNTPVYNILVDGCLFGNGNKGIGSHSSTVNYWHKNIKITNCHFQALKEEAISLNDYQQVIIANNTLTDCWKGIYVSTTVNQPCRDFTITGNTMQNMKPANSESRGIHITGINTANRFLKNIVLSNNIIRGSGRHGLGIDYCENVTISNNQVSENGGTGIWLYRSSVVVAKNNICLKNNSKSVGVGDMGIGAGTGLSTDSQDITCSDNQAGVVYFHYGTTNRVIFTTNIVAVKLTTAGTKANHQVFGNYLTGKWLP